MTFFKRLMEIKEEQLRLERHRATQLIMVNRQLSWILKVLEGRKDGKRKISRKD